MRKKNNKGSHVSFAIAFVLFIGFTIFVLNMINPLTKTNTNNIILKDIEKKIIQNTSQEIEIISIKNACLNADINNLPNNLENGVTKVYLLNSISLNPNSCSPPYEIGLRKKENYLFSDKLQELADNYELNYPSVKSFFNIPSNKNFGFEFTYENGDEIKAKKEIPSTEVYSKLIKIDYFNGIREKGELKIIIW